VSAIATPDFPQLGRAARRTTAVRAALVLGALVLLAFAFLASRTAGSPVGALLPAGSSTVVVLDISASISGPTNRRVRATLRTLAFSKGRAGLVVFSDAAYELLPPGTPTRELRPLLRFFTPSGGSRLYPTYPSNPWNGTFTGGTRISAGLEEARRALARARIRHGLLILVSDLEDPEDPAQLADAVTALQRAHVGLRIVPLFPRPENTALWQGLAGADAIVASPTLPDSPLAAARKEAQPFQPGLPATLLALSALLVLLLAANERWCGRLVLRRSG
jgi:VWA domain-containing protein